MSTNRHNKRMKNEFIPSYISKNEV